MAFVLLSWCRVRLSLGIQIQAVFHMDGLRCSAIHAEVQIQLFFVVSTSCRDKTQRGFHRGWSQEKKIFEGMQKQALLSGTQSGRGLSGVNMRGCGVRQTFFHLLQGKQHRMCVYVFKSGVIYHRDKPSQFNNLVSNGKPKN